MPKEKNYNPVQAQRKAEKAKAIKKGKAELTNRRNERLVRKNPERIQSEIDELKAITDGGGVLSKHEQAVLAGLEKELRAVQKAREALGDAAPTFRSGAGGGRHRDDDNDDGPGGGVLGKRRRKTHHHDGNPWSDTDADDDVPDDVREIPMPRDTPPPIPREAMDVWHARRREAWQRRHGGGGDGAAGAGAASGTNANTEPVVSRDGRPRPTSRVPAATSSATPIAEAKTVYEAKPIVRDLQKEAVAAFVPTAVKMKLERAKGVGGLMEPEEADALEREGYLRAAASASASSSATQQQHQEQQRRLDEDEEAGSGVTATAAGDARRSQEDEDEAEYDDFGTRRHPRVTVEDVEDEDML